MTRIHIRPAPSPLLPQYANPYQGAYQVEIKGSKCRDRIYPHAYYLDGATAFAEKLSAALQSEGEQVQIFTAA